MNRVPNLVRAWFRRLGDPDGSAIVELAVSLPLLVVFIVGIYDFSGAFNQKQKIEHAAQEGAIVAGAQPTSDIETTNGDPQSLHPVVTAIFNSLAANGVLPLANQSTCKPSGTPTQSGTTLQWQYAITGCPDELDITINRGWTQAVTGATGTFVAGTQVTVTYPYHWHFNSAIQLLVPGATYSATTSLSETASVHNQM